MDKRKVRASMASRVVVYTEVGDAQCMRAKQILHQLSLQYTDISLDSFPHCRAEMLRRSNGDETLPQIFIGSRRVAGCDELLQLSSNRSLWDEVLDQLQLFEPKFPLPHPDSAAEYCDENANHDGHVEMWLPDEFVRLLGDIKRAGLVRDHRVGLIKIYRNSFKGAALVEWLIKERDIKRGEALEIGQELLDRHFAQQTTSEHGVETFSPDRYYQLVEDDENRPLNTGPTSEQQNIPVAEFNETLVRLLQPVYDDILTDNGRTILYCKLVDNPCFARLLAYCRDLQSVDLMSSRPDERLALLINVYNIMLIHMTLKFGAPTSVWQRRKFTNSTYYNIGDMNFSLQSIFNGVLRGNRKGLGMLWRPFGKVDQRLPLVLPECEPLVHFAISTGTRSSSPLRPYTCRHVREEMRENAQKMLAMDDVLKVDERKSTIYLLRTFKWFAEDFGGSVSKTIEWIMGVLDSESEEKHKLKKMFYTGSYHVDYLNFDWTPNGKEKDCLVKRPSMLPCRENIQLSFGRSHDSVGFGALSVVSTPADDCEGPTLSVHLNSTSHTPESPSPACTHDACT